jgi:purine catabolism regulator
MHRRSLRTRIARVEQALGLTLDRFEDRTELWALLASIDLAAADAD